MRTDIVLTLTGPDRVGIVEDVSKAMLDLDGNIETSRMARLGGEFAILALVSVPSERVDELEAALAHLADEGYKVTAIRTHAAAGAAPQGTWYRIEVQGADHEGIIQKIAHGLAQRGISIESAETWTTGAPTTGQPLFSMTALVAVPEDLVAEEWIAELDDAGREANVDITVSLADKE